MLNKKLKNFKTIYRKFCKNEVSLPLFSKDWWLDSVVGADNWDVSLVIKNEEVIASMPYIRKKRLGMHISTLPELTKYLGPWFKTNNNKYSKILGQQKAIMEELIKQLPNFDYFSQNWFHNKTNWLPFYWNGFKQTTNYTYCIDDLTDLDQVWSNFQENIRSDIKKSINRYNLAIKESPSIKDFIIINKKVFERQNIKVPYSEEVILRIDEACAHHKSRKIFLAVDKNNVIHAGVYIVWDNQYAYYLMSGGDPKLRNSGATSFCLWEAIKFASTVTKKFDFEGSMIEPIEKYIRAFGAKQKLIFTISKTPSFLLRLRSSLISLIK